MKFALNLISFLLIVFGGIFLAFFSNCYINNKEKLTKEQIQKAESIIEHCRFYSLCAVILGVGIIIARIFS